METSKLVLVKMIGTKRFEVELYLMPNNEYCIRYENKVLQFSDFSESIQDFKTASILFDLKIQDLEGN